ncbi:MAG: FadR family transcriptional regulator [Alphaproteobacteria bacterium]|nr:MAG: FadR family transcriptional regulator [Alphaproteobacteria bacterium]
MHIIHLTVVLANRHNGENDKSNNQRSKAPDMMTQPNTPSTSYTTVTTSQFTPLSPRMRRSSSIAAELRRLISSGQLKPGDQLPTEATLCRQFGVSRTTLREAIQMLRTSGLLDVTPGRGSFIRTPDLTQLLADLALTTPATRCNGTEINHLRGLIQRDIIGRLTRVQTAQRSELHNFTLSRQAAPEVNAEAEANWHLHMARLAGGTLNHLMLQTLLAMELQNRIQRFHNADEVMRTIQTQMRFNSALVDGDFALAERVLTQYLTPGVAPAPSQVQLQQPQSAA